MLKSYMAEHLAVLSARTLNRLLRQRVLVFGRRRREAPIGRLSTGDRVFFKLPGGPVMAEGTVSRMREGRAGGRYVLTARFRRLRKLAVPFPVVKHDRRSWVVCSAKVDERQQTLITPRVLTVRELLQAVHAGHRRLPSRRAVTRLLAQSARQHRIDGSMVLWLALLAAIDNPEHIVDTILEYTKKPARRVVPFAVFS